MPLTAMEVAMQTMGCVLTEYAVKDGCVMKLTPDGLDRLMHEQVKNFGQGESCSNVFKVIIPLCKNTPRCGSCPAGGIIVTSMNSKISVEDNKLVMESRFS